MANTINPKNDMSTIVTNLNSATDNGTRIVKKGDGMDKDAFFKILAAELANQDPMNTKDSTAYVAQLAQFSSLEQMANLNTTLSFSSASNLVGKKVELNQTDEDGMLISGVVKNISRNGDIIKLSVMTKDGEIPVNFRDVMGISKEQNGDITNTAVLIGKTVKVRANDGSKDVYQGVVKGVNKTDTDVNLKVEVSSKEINRELGVLVGSTDKDSPRLRGNYTGKDDVTIGMKYNAKAKEYEYRIAPIDDWKKMTSSIVNYEGLELKKPYENPTGDVVWGTNIKANSLNAEIKEVPSSNIVEVIGS